MHYLTRTPKENVNYNHFTVTTVYVRSSLIKISTYSLIDYINKSNYI